MDGFELLRTFSEVASQGSFSRAAARLGISKASVSKHVATLESRFNVRLLNRSTRSVSLTDAGRLLQARCAPLMEMIEQTTSELQARGSHPSGRLLITAPHGMVQTAFPRLLGDFLTCYPDVQLDLKLSNRMIDLVDEGVDIALRFGRIGDENLIVRRLRRMGLTLCATPRYWARRGIPLQPDDMRKHDVLAYSVTPGPPQIAFEVDGQPYNVPIRGRMDSNDASALIGAALADIGAVCVPDLLAQPYVEGAHLVPVLQDFMPSDIWLYAAYTQRRQNSAALRALLEILELRMRDSVPSPAALAGAAVAPHA